MKKVMVILATYNGERFLIEQIDSILNQEGVYIDIKIFDDGSTDDTLKILKKIEENNTIAFHQNVPGKGSAAKNFLYAISQLNFEEDFQYVAFSDQDDLWLPTKMIAATDLLEKTSSDLYCSNLTKWDTAKNSYSVLKKDFPQKKFDYLFEGGSAGCTYVFTKKLAIDLKFFLDKIELADWHGFSHDWLVYFFARSRNFKVVIDGNSHIHYRLHDSNVHGHLNKLSLSTIKEKSLQVLKGYYQRHANFNIKLLQPDSEEFMIYSRFLGNYFSRNGIIWKYNTRLMRDNKKFLIFAILNLLKFK
jgi:rhamnosyltransferase